ncbi:cation diffusion facilitator family transporter [Faunimonas pinastri]|uniref:Cation diffusion facilitator family transporter n=1 Tax=Faunimonas pinastri TaxID=1855383 RepID=A0A1H9CQB8_9HYPH|nr:cation diffusion facilitator family transporter [Faunimonas pinastri]SEQ03369.1 cation diffusion facilitator family transporter [Faunimonas pinastri]
MAAAGGSNKVIYAALSGNLAIAVVKFGAALFTGSSAMLSEGIHSVIDTGNQGLLLFGTWRAKRPPDRSHPFGYSAEIYFWSFLVAIMIFGVGAGVSFYQGVHRLQNPQPIENTYLNMIVLVVSFFFEGFSWTVAVRELNAKRGKESFLATVKRSKDPSVFTTFFEDSAALLGLVVAFVGIACAHWLGWEWADPVASIVIAVVLAMTAILLAVEIKGLLTGEAALPEVVGVIREIVGSQDGIEEINEVRSLQLGPDNILLAVSADFRDTLSAADVERIIATTEEALRLRFPQIGRVFIEAQSRKDHERFEQWARQKEQGTASA